MAKTGLLLSTMNFNILEIVLYQRWQYWAIITVCLQIFNFPFNTWLVVTFNATVEQQCYS